MPKIKFTCKQCGKPGEHFPSQPRKFCSQQCRSRWNADHGHMPTKPRRGVTEPCKVCGADVYKSKGQQATKLYCSVTCKDIGQRTGHRQVCPRCSSEFYVHPSSEARRFCSRECYTADRVLLSSVGRMHNGRHVIKDHDGYLRIWEPDHPKSVQGRVAEHRWVVEQDIGRLLQTDEHVHHINGIKDDNRLENLAVLDAQEHRLLTAAELKERRSAVAAELAEYRRRYGPLT
jgi:endogenous inhibitor of DNA gyrase (YacG/DUF329 family)